MVWIAEKWSNPPSCRLQHHCAPAAAKPLLGNICHILAGTSDYYTEHLTLFCNISIRSKAYDTAPAWIQDENRDTHHPAARKFGIKAPEVLLNKKAHGNTMYALKYAVQEQPTEPELFTPSVHNSARSSCWARHALWTGAGLSLFWLDLRKHFLSGSSMVHPAPWALKEPVLTELEDFWHSKYHL